MVGWLVSFEWNAPSVEKVQQFRATQIGQHMNMTSGTVVHGRVGLCVSVWDWRTQTDTLTQAENAIWMTHTQENLQRKIGAHIT